MERLKVHIGEGNGTPLQYSCLENPMDGGAWKAAVHGVASSQTRLSDFTFTFHFHALEKEMATHLCSCLENPTGGGAWWAAFSGVAQSRTRLKRLSSSSRGTNGQAFLIRALPILPSLFCEVLPITCCARFLNTRCFPVLSPLLFLWSPAYFTF